MPEQLLNLLKICLIVLLYLFFLRVLRAVWAEVGAAGPTTAPAKERRRVARFRSTGSSKKAPTGLVILQPDDWAGRSMAMAPHITIGRDPNSTLPITDTYLSHQHARILAGDGGYVIEDLGSTNGTYLNGKRLTAPAPLRRGDVVEAGNLKVEMT